MDDPFVDAYVNHTLQVGYTFDDKVRVYGGIRNLTDEFPDKTRASLNGHSGRHSYAGRTCGVCYYACPFPDTALRLKTYAQPVIDEDACVGCGNCERACIHLPQAVRITPASARKAAA